MKCQKSKFSSLYFQFHQHPVHFRGPSLFLSGVHMTYAQCGSSPVNKAEFHDLDNIEGS